jgi:hypothetical protein
MRKNTTMQTRTKQWEILIGEDNYKTRISGIGPEAKGEQCRATSPGFDFSRRKDLKSTFSASPLERMCRQFFSILGEYIM